GSPGASAPANGTPADPATTSTTVINGILATVTNSGSLPRQHHTLRVVSARGDLAGQRELAWAADSGYAVGSARCTQNFRFNVDSPARVRPTLMLCWRTSPAKTVYTIAVDVDNRPSAAASVAVLNQVWTSMH
ncbi:MAG TPA: hypothetical protein VJT31_23090, partial [Rugosimonospora sp.]|nr:hypothetical protein [Rugosimonospora sp.]